MICFFLLFFFPPASSLCLPFGLAFLIFSEHLGRNTRKTTNACIYSVLPLRNLADMVNDLWGGFDGVLSASFVVCVCLILVFRF
jgi:hypothetical protein